MGFSLSLSLSFCEFGIYKPPEKEKNGDFATGREGRDNQEQVKRGCGTG